jgi:hypothetical protein
MPVQLEQAILDEGVKFVHFFEGRILSGKDLRDEQQADRQQRRRLGRAVGAGIAVGLEVDLVSGGGGGESPVVNVRPGWAVNLEGEPLGLCTAQNLELVRSMEQADESREIFHTCVDVPPGMQIPNGIGFYVLAIGPASGFQGEAPKSGLDTAGVASGCGKRYATLGIRFRLVRLDPLALSGVADPIKNEIADLAPLSTAQARSRLRNLLAHVCLGTPQTRALPVDPFEVADGDSVHLSYGAIDDLRASGALLDCEVPLALLSWTLAGVGFLDLWAVRRRIVRSSIESAWPLLASDRRRAEAEAAAFQFQRHLSELRTALPDPQLARADEYFRYLPAAGIVQLADSSHVGFNADSFFQGLDTSGPHPLDGARLIPLFDLSHSHSAIDLQPEPGQPSLIWRYTVGENANAPSGIQRYQVFATGHLPFQGDPLFELTTTEKCTEIEEAIDGLRDALAATQTGTLRVEVREATGAPFGGVGVGVQHLVTGEVRTEDTDNSGVAQFLNCPSGSWRASVAIPGFQTAPQTGTVPAAGTVTLTLTPTRTGGVVGGIEGGLIGVAVDNSGIPLPDVEIQVRHVATGLVRTIFTASDGSYSLDRLPTGEYEIIANPGAGIPLVIDDVQVPAGGRRFVGLNVQG